MQDMSNFPSLQKFAQRYEELSRDPDIVRSYERYLEERRELEEECEAWEEESAQKERQRIADRLRDLGVDEGVIERVMADSDRDES